MRPSLMYQLLMFHYQDKSSLILTGAPGCGKTALMQQVAKAVDRPLVIDNIGTMDPVDARGIPFRIEMPDGRSATEWAKPKQFLQNEPVIYFMDEFGQGSTPMQCTMAPVLAEKRLVDIFLHPDTWVVAATNLIEHRAGVNRMPGHVPNRCTVVNLETDIEDWSLWALENGIDFRLVGFLRYKPDLLSDYDANRMINPTPRQWAWVGERLGRMSPDIMLDSIAGRVGEGPAVELIAFCKLINDIPSREEIYMSPKTAAVPEEISARFMVASMLSSTMTASNIDMVMPYVSRLTEDFQCVIMKTVAQLHPGVINTKSYREWAIKFSAVLR